MKQKICRDCFKTALLTGVALGVAPYLQAAEAIPKYNLPQKSFEESRSAINIAGTLLAGHLAGDLKKEIRNRTLYIHGIKDSDRTICVNIYNSADTYKATAVFENPKLGSQISIKIPTRNKSVYKSAAGELVVKAQASDGSECRYDDAYLIPSWEPLEAISTIHAFINDGAADVAMFSLEQEESVSDCYHPDMLISGTRKNFARYNLICTQTELKHCESSSAFSVMTIANQSTNGYKGEIRRICP